ncbi:MAG: hypothetical protein ACLUD0_16350 [Eubacterium ramulus]
MELFINKISHYLPDSVVPNSYFKEVNGLDDEWIYSRTGIKNRSKAAANENTNTMGIKAVDLATTDLPYPMEEIDLIIAATYSPTIPLLPRPIWCNAVITSSTPNV